MPGRVSGDAVASPAFRSCSCSSVGPLWAGFGKSLVLWDWGRFRQGQKRNFRLGRKLSGRKCRGCCCTPAWFTAPGNAGRVGLFRASGPKNKKGLLNSFFEKNGAANRINGGIPPNIPGLRRQKGVLQDFGTKGQIQVRAVAPPGHAGESQGAIPAGRLPQ